MPTALQLGQDGWQQYLKAARGRYRPPMPTPSERRELESLLGRIGEAVDALKHRFGVRKVILFGSLAHRAWFASDTDVDLAVEGLRVQDYWEAWRVAEDIIGDRSVDMVEIEKVKPSLKQSILRNGIEL